MLLQHSFLLADAFIAVVWLDPFPLQNLDPETSVHGVVAGKVAIRKSSADLMAALVGDALEVAHSKAICNASQLISSSTNGSEPCSPGKMPGLSRSGPKGLCIRYVFAMFMVGLRTVRIYDLLLSHAKTYGPRSSQKRNAVVAGRTSPQQHALT